MTSFYEASTSGLNFDRFTDELFGESTKLRMKQAYWTAKQLLREKMGRREDEHLMAADAELDMQLQQFQRIRESTKQLLDGLGQMQREFVDLVKYEFDMAEMLSDCQGEKEHLQRVMQMTANSETMAAKERQKMVRSIVRLYHELDEFYERAILDSEQTVEAVEKVRLEYRGSLLWMKNCSETLDPERKDSNNLEDFRTVQNVVKGNKRRLDQLKEDVAQKVDLLQKARAKLFEDCLAEYKADLLQFFESTATEYCACAEEMSGLESYEIDVLKILNDPIGVVLEKQKEEKTRENRGKTIGMRGPDAPPPLRRRMESENDESLIELEDVEVAEICEPKMDRVRELLLLDDGPDGGGKSEEGWGEEAEEEIDLMKPASSGLNLLKHSNELAALGLAALEEGKRMNGGNVGEKKRSRYERTMDLLSELDSAGLTHHSSKGDFERKESESPLAMLPDELEAKGEEGPNGEFEDILLLGLGGRHSTSAKPAPQQMDEAIPRLAPPPKQPISKIAKGNLKADSQIVDVEEPMRGGDNQKRGCLLEEVEEAELFR